MNDMITHDWMEHQTSVRQSESCNKILEKCSSSIYFRKMQNEVELIAVAPEVESAPVEPTPVVVEEEIKNDAPIVVEHKINEKKPVEAEIVATAPNNEWANVESFAGASFSNTTQNIANTIIGAGILSIAFSIMKAGVLGSIILIIAVLVPSILTSYYLSVATIYTNEFIYGDIGTKLCNKTVGICSNITQVLLDFGINVAYMNVFFNQIVDISNELFSLDLTKYKIVRYTIYNIQYKIYNS